MIQIDDKAFESLVQDALDKIPEPLWAQVENVAVIVEDEPPPGEDLLGLYTGVSLQDRYDYSAVMPDTIHIFKGPICRMCETTEEVVEEVLITVVHEVAHYFGFDDDQLHALGWG